MSTNLFELEGNEVNQPATCVSEAFEKIQADFDNSDPSNDWSPFDNDYMYYIQDCQSYAEKVFGTE
jgi:hypothetical protein